MLPHQFRRLLELLRGQLGAIEKAIQEQTAANNDAQKAADIERRDIPGITASLIYPNEEKEATATDREQTHREQEQIIASQRRTATWTRNACIAAIFYGLIAAGQGLLMWRTYGEIEKQTKAATCAANAASEQTKLLRQQLEASVGAIVYIDKPFGLGTPGIVGIGLHNMGHYAATDIKAVVRVSLHQVPTGKLIENFAPILIAVPRINPPTAWDVDPMSGRNNISNLGPAYPLSPVEDAMLKNGTAAVSVDLSLSYNNGFETLDDGDCFAHFQRLPVWVKHLSNGSIESGLSYGNTWPCSNLDWAMNDAIKSERNAKEQEPK
jgi:hypothetical protein